MKNTESDKPIFYIVDVFAENKYEGNQLAVFRNTSALSDRDMQKLAREMHFSETTYILSEKEHNGGYNVRIFTPENELPFAGHPTLGTAFIIQREILRKPVNRVALNLKIGQIPVAFSYKSGEADTLWMKQVEPVFGETFDATPVAESLSLKTGDIDNRYPIQQVSTGVPFIITPLKTLDALRKVKTVKDKYFKLVESSEAKTILVFCPETRAKGNSLSVRVFPEYYGIPEDPATGSANGCLAGYLVKHRYFGKESIDIRVEQGHEIGRPSLLLLKAQARNGHIDVNVGGKTIMVAKGSLF